MRAADAATPAARCAEAILDAFDDYQRQFLVITRRAPSRFDRRDWHGMQADAAERLDLYGRVITTIVAWLQEALGARLHERALWVQMKAAFAWRIRERLHLELAETFFNSVTRRIFATVGVDAPIEFQGSDFDLPPPGLDEPLVTSYRAGGALDALFRRILDDLPFSAPFADLEDDARRIAAAVEASPERGARGATIEAIDVFNAVFYRSKGAYVVGRIRRRAGLQPLVLALLHEPEGVKADAVLLTQDEASIVFSFARSYFHVEVANPREMIGFLKTLMPLKPVAELYIALGYNKHGKTELYRDIMRHLERTRDQFEIARGDPGMVMIVFTMHSFDVVFKVIRDEFAYPKTTTRTEVMEKYRFVFRHDRAGRLVDAQEFENLSFAMERFSDALLEELRRAAPQTVTIGDGSVYIRHLYVERRLTPLNLHLRDAPEAAAREAVVDYGQAVRDMAATNIFPGDMLLKNFGVSRHGRVIFYDYDELCRVTDCNFRDIPLAADTDDMGGAEPWFFVGKNDIFPEEFLAFLGLKDGLRQVFLEHHRELLGADYWRHMKGLHEAGEVLDIFPYRKGRRIGPGPPGPASG